jgi:hypothetical protein
MNKVTIFNNALDPFDSATTCDVEDVCDFLEERFGGKFPDTAKIYHRFIAESNNVTPYDEASTEKFEKMTGHFFVVVWPADPITILVIVAIALAATAIGLAFLLRPNVNGQNESSPNNELTDRQNKPRPNERIPYIVGTVRSTPDLLVYPYKAFVAYQELEYCYMGIGQGSYTVLDCKDDETPIDDINGEYVAVYPPSNSPNSVTPAPQATFGTAPAIIPKVTSIKPSGSVNGQVLRAPNSGNFRSNNNIAFQYGGVIHCNDSNVDFNDFFVASTLTQDSFLQIFGNDDDINASDPAGIVHSVGLDGVYKILAVTTNTITLANTATVNPNWNIIATFSGSQSTFYHTFSINTTGEKWVGPFILNVIDLSEVWANFVAENGLYYIDTHGNQKPLTVTLELGVTAIDATNTPIGDEIVGTINIVGTSHDRNVRGATLKMGLPTVGAVSVRARRITQLFIDSRDTFSQEIKWRDLFAVSPVAATDFGDITTVLAITAQTPDALSIKSRKINLLVTRNLPTWINRTAPGVPQFSTTLHPTNCAADIICAMALDPSIGRRVLAELNVPEIYQVADNGHLGGEHVNGDIVTYFGTFLMTEFCYTFDDSKVSFEESLANIAQAINCVAYRSGSQIGLSFEKQTANSKLLFNHRNKIPDSETRTVSFGVLNDNDGIQYDYIDPNAPNYPNVDTTMTLYFPADQSAINPKIIKSIGVRNYVQAWTNASRLYQKLLHTNCQTEFEATQEAALCVLQDRVLVADNTRTETQDGEILGQTGLTITTSQDVTFGAGTYTVFLQHYDGTVEAMAVTAGTDNRSMVLSAAPALPLVTDRSMFAVTTYLLVNNADVGATKRALAFLISDKQPQTSNTFKLTATNYTDLFYSHDQDLATAVIAAPPAGYGPQGYTGSGLVKADGTGYTPPARTTFNNSTYTGSALGTSNNPAPIVTAAPVDASNSSTLVDGETPAGTIDGTNGTFTLLHAPNPATALKLYNDGLRLIYLTHFTLSGATITILSPPVLGDNLVADYRY